MTVRTPSSVPESATLGVVAGGGGDDSAGALVVRELGHAVERAADLEAVHGLQIFALDQHFVADALGQRFHVFEWRVRGHAIDGGGDDLLQIFRAGDGLRAGVFFRVWDLPCRGVLLAYGT